jgi:hypothetical protein
MVLVRLLCPATRRTSFLGNPRCAAIALTTASLALPSLAGALTLTASEPSLRTTTSSLRLLGRTETLIRNREDRGQLAVPGVVLYRSSSSARLPAFQPETREK